MTRCTVEPSGAADERERVGLAGAFERVTVGRHDHISRQQSCFFSRGIGDRRDDRGNAIRELDRDSDALVLAAHLRLEIRLIGGHEERGVGIKRAHHAGDGAELKLLLELGLVSGGGSGSTEILGFDQFLDRPKLVETRLAGRACARVRAEEIALG